MTDTWLSRTGRLSLSIAACWPVVACVSLLLIVCVALPGCERHEAASHPDWNLRFKVAFLSADLATAREPLRPSEYRLVFPYVCGDLYGPASTGDFFTPVGEPAGELSVDLNQTNAALRASLEPTQFSMPHLTIQPAEARIARLQPLILQANGIEPVGRLDWLDANSRQRLMLVYFDRPAHIEGTGGSTADGAPVRYDIEAEAAGYVWVGFQTRKGAAVYATVPRPHEVWLAVTPGASRERISAEDEVSHK